jgi:hypothetical protein
MYSIPTSKYPSPEDYHYTSVSIEAAKKADMSYSGFIHGSMLLMCLTWFATTMFPPLLPACPVRTSGWGSFCISNSNFLKIRSSVTISVADLDPNEFL